MHKTILALTISFISISCFSQNQKYIHCGKMIDVESKKVLEKKIPGFYPAIIVPKALKVGPQIQETFAKAYKAGVKIAFGTDSGVSYPGKNADEFVYMCEAGMTPWDAVLCATVNTADLLRISEKLGSIKVGKIADIVAVTDNPLENIATLQDVKFVLKEGVVYKMIE